MSSMFGLLPIVAVSAIVTIYVVIPVLELVENLIRRRR